MVRTFRSDSSLTHPFFTMLVAIRAAAHRLKLAEVGPEIHRLRAAYIEDANRQCNRILRLSSLRKSQGKPERSERSLSTCDLRGILRQKAPQTCPEQRRRNDVFCEVSTLYQPGWSLIRRVDMNMRLPCTYRLSSCLN